jgi:TRAP-type C4-dicarboxylate transport system permease small subunit
MSSAARLFFGTGRALARLLDATQVIAALLVLAMMLHVVLDVILKYTIQDGFPATVEVVSNYYLVGLAFLPLAFTEKQNAHISVEVATSNLSMRLQRIGLALAWMLSIVTYAILARQTWLDAMVKQKIGAFIFSQGVKLYIWPSYYFLPVGFGLMALTLVYRLAALVWPRADGLASPLPLDRGGVPIHD